MAPHGDSRSYTSVGSRSRPGFHAHAKGVGGAGRGTVMGQSGQRRVGLYRGQSALVELGTWRPRGSRVRFCPGWGAPVARRARTGGVVQVRIAAAIEVNQATIARFEDGSAWPRKPEEVLMAYASELEMDVRLLWVQALVLWLETSRSWTQTARSGFGRRSSGCRFRLARGARPPGGANHARCGRHWAAAAASRTTISRDDKRPLRGRSSSRSVASSGRRTDAMDP